MARGCGQGPCRGLVVSVEETFAKVVGRQASDEERQRLYRLREALGLRDNDAFWSIVMALEYYDSFFRQYPAQLAAHTQRCIEDARTAFAAAAERDAAHAQRTLSEKVAETSVAIARRLAERPVGIHRVTMLGRGGGVRRAVRQRGVQIGCAREALLGSEAGDDRTVAKSGGGDAEGTGRVDSVRALVPAAVYGARTGW